MEIISISTGVPKKMVKFCIINHFNGCRKHALDRGMLPNLAPTYNINRIISLLLSRSKDMNHINIVSTETDFGYNHSIDINNTNPILFKEVLS